MVFTRPNLLTVDLYSVTWLSTSVNIAVIDENNNTEHFKQRCVHVLHLYPTIAMDHRKIVLARCSLRKNSLCKVVVEDEQMAKVYVGLLTVDKVDCSLLSL